MKKSRRIFLGYIEENRHEVEQIYRRLKDEGLDPWMDRFEVMPGMAIGPSLERAVREAGMFLAFFSKKAEDRQGWWKRLLEQSLNSKESSNSTIPIIPVLLEPCAIPNELKDIQAARLYEPGGFENLLSALRSLDYQRKPVKNLLIKKIRLTNIRCFEHLELSFGKGGKPLLRTMFLGDNAAGKTTVLRSIAAGLCGESEAAALMKEIPGGFIRSGCKSGIIHIELAYGAGRSKSYSISTKIEKKSEESPETVRQETEPPSDFPWNDIFVCGYGAHRSAIANADYKSYNALNAVKSLFDYTHPLQNPEVVLLRTDPVQRAALERKLMRILLLDSRGEKIAYPRSGFEIEGPWGNFPFRVLSDGYRSTVQWVLDFLGWAIYADRLPGKPEIGGILLIDELEQHLHPRWQRYIADRLAKQFPSTQIVSATHTPLIASGVADLENSQLIRLELSENGAVETSPIDSESLAGKRADQVLASKAFGIANRT